MIGNFFTGAFIGLIILLTCMAISSIADKSKREKIIEEALSRSAYKTFSPNLWLSYDLCIDRTRKLMLVNRYGYTIIPTSALRNVSHQIIYDYKTESNVSAGQALADGMLAGLTGVGIIREIGETQVEYVKEVILKIDLDYKGNFTKVISTDIESATKFYEWLPSLLEVAPKTSSSSTYTTTSHPKPVKPASPTPSQSKTLTSTFNTPSKKSATTSVSHTTSSSIPYQNIFKEKIKQHFPNESFSNDDVVFNIRDELAILKPSNLICISKLVFGEMRYYIVPAFDKCSYRKSNGNLYFSFKFSGDLPNDDVHRMLPGMEVKVITATLNESEYVFSHIRTYLSVNVINHFD